MQAGRDRSILYRCLIFLTTLLAIFNCVTVVQLGLTVSDDYAAGFRYMSRAATLSYVLFFGTVLCTASSVLSTNGVTKLATVIRTLVLLCMTVAQFLCLRTARLWHVLELLYRTYGDVTKYTLLHSDYDSLGITTEELNSTLDPTDTDTSRMYFYIVYAFVAALLYLIFTCTSVHALRKKRAALHELSPDETEKTL